LDLITTGAGQQQRRLRGDLKREVSSERLESAATTDTDRFLLLQVLSMLEASGRAGLPWTRAVKSLEEQSSVPVDQAEFNEVIRTLEHEGAIKVVGAGERRTIKRISD
jgi:DNA replication licensing factor MCM4